MTNVIVTIEKFTGTADNKTYTTLGEYRGLLLTAGADILSLYPDVPVGAGYMLTVDDNLIVPVDSRVTVTTTELTPIPEATIFYVLGEGVNTMIAGIRKCTLNLVKHTE